MTWTYTAGSGASKDFVRLLISDTDTTVQIFSDEQIGDFLTLTNSVVLLAAASALDVMASSEVYVQKVTRSLDLSTDGRAVASELRAQAKSLRDRYAAGDGDFDGQFAWAEEILTPWGARDRIIDQMLRGQL